MLAAPVQLLVQTIGVLAVGAGVLAVARPGRAPRPSWAGVALVATAVGGFVFFAEIYRTGSLLTGVHEQYGRYAEVDRRAAGGANFARNNEPFLRWVDARVPKRDRVYLECDRLGACAEGLDEWITNRLGPRLFVGRPERADWVLFYEADPARAPYARRLPRAAFAPRFELARVTP